MEVTEPQALALQSMFNYWNYCGNAGHDATVGFYAFGCCDFHPECVVSFDKEIKTLTPEIEKIAVRHHNWVCERVYDYDPISVMLNNEETSKKSQNL